MLFTFLNLANITNNNPVIKRYFSGNLYWGVNIIDNISQNTLAICGLKNPFRKYISKQEKIDMKNIFIMILMLLTTGTVKAQTETRVAKIIKGKVVNEATNEPVAYTNVGIEDTFYGTASDEEGNFQLKIPEEMVSRQILFSSVGFQGMKLPVANLFDKEFNIIKLMPQTYDIEKIDVAGRSLVLARILRMASENTPYNFMSGPFNLLCSLSKEVTTDDTLNVSTRAEVLIYDKTGYSAPSKTDAFGMRAYQIKKDEPDYSFASSLLNLDEIIGLDWVRNASSVLNPALINQFELELTGEPVIDGSQAWVIAFRQRNPTLAASRDFHATAFEGKIIILKDDYSVKKIEGNVKAKMHNRQGKSLAVSGNNKNYFKDVAYGFTVTYSQMKPDMFSMNKTYQYNGSRIEENTQLKVNGVQIENIVEVAGRNYFVR